MGNLSLGGGQTTNKAIQLVDKLLSEFFDPIVMVLFALSVFLFFWGLVVFITKTDNPEARKTGLRHIVYGLLGLLIITSVYAILTLIANILGVNPPSLLNR